MLELAEQRKLQNEVVNEIKEYLQKQSKKKIKDPRKMIHGSFKDKIQNGSKIFERDYRDQVNRKGFIKLLDKIQESDFTLKQIKNGCSTLFDKPFMKLKYTNPHLSVGEIQKELDDYFKITKPQRFFDDLEKSQMF